MDDPYAKPSWAKSHEEVRKEHEEAMDEWIPTYFEWLRSVLGLSQNKSEVFRMPGFLFALTLICCVAFGGVFFWALIPGGEELAENYSSHSGNSESSGKALAAPALLAGGLMGLAISPFFYLQRALRLGAISSLLVTGLVAYAILKPHLGPSERQLAADARAEAARQRHLAVLQEPVVPFVLDQEPWPRLSGPQAGDGDLSRLRSAAEQGDPDAQVRLGHYLWNDSSAPENKWQALSWAQKAAEAGQPDAAFFVAVCEANGTGVTQALRTSSDRFERLTAEPVLGPLAQQARHAIDDEWRREARRIAAEQALREEP
jgi:hypothetical protein